MAMITATTLDLKQSVWPPAASSGELRALFAEAERSRLHSVHVASACAFFALSGLSSTFSTIGFTALIVVWLVRLPRTIALNAALLRLPIVWLGLAWTAWAGASVLWTHNPEQWRVQFTAWRI